MGDRDPTPSLSRRTLLTGGIAAVLTTTAAGILPVAEEDADALRPFNYPSGGHGDWWPSYVAHAGTPARPDRHYHYIRDQLIVAQDGLSGLRKGLRRRAGVEVGRSLDELGLALVQLRRPHASVPELVDELHEGWDPATLWAVLTTSSVPARTCTSAARFPSPPASSCPAASRWIASGRGRGDRAARLRCHPGASLVRRPGRR
jgi:hypothetical protein